MRTVRLLLGPAGSGKTQRCLAEIRTELAARPQGPPLILLAPKQSTFQIERQLLEDDPPAGPALQGYARLQILSFDRLARFVLDTLSATNPRLLSEEGRLMVLRALLTRHQSQLGVFRSAARLPGFAQQLGQVLRELQRRRIGPRRLAELARDESAPPSLQAKLKDLGLIMATYDRALSDQRLEDADRLPDLASATLQALLRSSETPPSFGGLWLDGFAEMTVQELNLLATLVPHCAQSTLAFCLEGEEQEDRTWLSTWALVSQTVRDCRQRLESEPDLVVTTEVLPRRQGDGRFAANRTLAHLEAAWASGRPFPEPPCGLELVQAATPDAEAVWAARTILQHARAGGRYREAAIMVRDLRTHAVPLRRVLTRFGIPYFLDQREPVAHHPLAELTRSALRMVAFGWLREDWFGALKSGLVHPSEQAIDELENEALAHGWDGRAWLEPLRFEKESSRNGPHEQLRRELIPPFVALEDALLKSRPGATAQPTGSELASALRGLWTAVGAADQLQRWSEAGVAGPHGARRHLTVWQQMQDWLDNLALAFEHDALPLRDWLPVLEAGLANLTVGVIPPALDQVLVGAIDRSRNPDLRLAIVLGLNEGRFPAPPPAPTMLTETESAVLERHGVFLSVGARLRIAHERYYGYIACTRAKERLVLAYAATDAEGKALNPSPFIDHFQRLFPALELQTFAGHDDWRNAAHLGELGGEWLKPGSPLALADRDEQGALSADSPFQELERQLAPLRAFRPVAELSADLAARIYGNPLRTSVSSLEQFGMCPFRFFIKAGLRAEERRLFVIDPRQLGNFQHEVLRLFHEELQGAGQRWRDLTPTQARERIGILGERVAQQLSGGLFNADGPSRFTRRALTEALQEFIAIVIGWMAQYAFDPTAVEWPFGMGEGGLDPWTLDLGDGRQLAFRGRIDRVDLGPAAPDGARWVVVHDYKSSGRQFDPVLLANGIQLQLPAYLAVLRGVPGAAARLGAPSLRPAGVFYVNLRGDFKGAPSREVALEDPAAVRRRAYRHAGRFDLAALPFLDTRGETKGDQFNYAYRKDGQINQNCPDPLPSEAFEALLADVEAQLRRMGREVLAGRVAVDPYVKGRERPCDQCDYAAICRIDPWTHRYRALREP